MKKYWLIIFAGLLSLVLLSPVFATRYDHGMPGVYNATPFTLGDGEGSGLSTDVNGRILISPSSTISASISTTSTLNVTPSTPSTSTTLTYMFTNTSSTVNIKSSAGRLYSGQIFNNSGGTIFVQFYDATTSPTLGASSTFSIPVGTGTHVILDASYFHFNQKYFSTGIQMVISSAFATSSPSSGYTGVNIMVEYD